MRAGLDAVLGAEVAELQRLRGVGHDEHLPLRLLWGRGLLGIMRPCIEPVQRQLGRDL
jgi:hypothetical protein